MHFLKLIIFVIGILNISNISKADNFLGNCNIGNEREYLNIAFKLMDEFNFDFKTRVKFKKPSDMSKEKLVYCENVSHSFTALGGTGLFFTMIPYHVYMQNGGGLPKYIDIHQMSRSSCIEFFIIEAFVVDKYQKDNRLRIILNLETGNYDLFSKWAYTKLITENCPRTNKRYFDKN